MAEKMTKIIFDATAKTTEVVDLTDAEVTEYHEQVARDAADRVEQEAAAQALVDLKTSARAKLVAGEPLTEEEAATLVI